MRGTDKRTGELFSYIDLEHRMRQDHPLRAIREMADAALAALSNDFDWALFADGIGAQVRVSVRRVKIAMASACPYQAEFRLAHARLSR